MDDSVLADHVPGEATPGEATPDKAVPGVTPGYSVLGVDACKAGWVGVVLTDAGRFEDVVVAATIANLVAAAAENRALAVVGIDIPIGLPDAEERMVDSAARRLLKGASSSVSPTPTRQAFAEATHAAASKRNLALTGKGISRQSWGLRAKIMDVEGWNHPALPFQVIEVHPELSFRAMAGAKTLRFNKRSWAGVVLPAAAAHQRHSDPGRERRGANRLRRRSRCRGGRLERLP